MRSLLIIPLLFLGCTNCLPKQRVIQQENVVYEQIEKALHSEMFADLPWPEEGWWKLFQDPLLDELIEKALCYNPSIEIAKIKIREAQADVRLAKAKLMPTLSGFADIIPQLLTRTGLFTPKLAPGSPFTYAQTDLDLNLSYDLDLWEQNRNTLRAERDVFFSQVYESRLSTLLLSLSVAETYFGLKTALQTEGIAREIAENRKIKRDLVEIRVQNALDDRVALLTAEQDYLNAVKYLKEAERAKELDEHALYTLVAEGVELPSVDPTLAVENLFPFPLPECLALNLIARRPDIQAQLWNIQSATRIIKVREADYYPNINISALIGLSSIFPDQLFNMTSSTYSYGPALNLPVFKGGEIEANIDLAVEDFRNQVEQYNQLVFQAVQELKDALTNVEKYNQEWKIAEENVSSTNASYALLLLRQESLSTKLNSLDQEQIYLSAISEKVAIENQLLASLLQMVKALGG